MITPVILSQRYQQFYPLVKWAASNARDTVLSYCDDQGYAFISRMKTLESVAEKIETGRFKVWSELDDLFACAVIIPTLTSEPAVLDFCENSFEVQRMTRRGQMRKAPELFRFDSTRIWAKLRRPPGIEKGANPDGYDVVFEIQVRSAFEHAWSVATHNLVYKSQTIKWKRLRLAAQIKATVEQLDTLILSFEEAAGKISESRWPEITGKRKIADRITKLKDGNLIPEELAPKDLSRLSDNLYALLKASGNGELLKDGQIDGRHIEKALRVFETELANIDSSLVPRSISLWQYFFAVCLEQEVIRPPFKGFACHITGELLGLYPHLGLEKIQGRFDYSA